MMKKLKCVKCGGIEINTSYHRNRYECSWSNRIDEGTNCEHLHHTCKNCMYSWTRWIKAMKTASLTNSKRLFEVMPGVEV